MSGARPKKRPNFFGKNNGQETYLDELAVADILNMYNSIPIIKLARKSYLGKIFNEVFTVSIPQMKISTNTEMSKIFEMHWIPFLKKVWDWCQQIGICPWYLKKMGKHYIPVVPEMELGYVGIVVNAQHEYEYLWYWSHGTAVDQERKMFWVVTENKPGSNGTIKSPLASLLPSYRSLLILQKAQDIAAKQKARPVHILEYTPNLKTSVNDNLVHHQADFGQKAAGIAADRRMQAYNLEIRQKTANLYKHLRETHQANLQQTSVQPTMWTDTPENLLEEMDAGLSNRTVALRPDFHYKSAAEPSLVQDYYKAELQFNTMAAAVMDFSLELLTPTGSARSQNIAGAESFQNSRNKDGTSFFAGVIKTVFLKAYYDVIKQGMDENREWQMSTYKQMNAPVLFPELDIQVDMANSSLVSYEDLRQMRMDGLITHETMGKHVFKGKNMPEQDRVALAWPDNIPKDLLVPPNKQQQQKKPAKKKTKTSDK